MVSVSTFEYSATITSVEAHKVLKQMTTFNCMSSYINNDELEL